MVDLTSFLLVGGLAELIEDCTDLVVATGEAAVALARRP